MTDVKWIKITTDMFNDEKIRLIESMPEKDAILIIWIKLLVQAGRTNAVNGGVFLSETIPYTDEMISTLFNRPLNTVRLALKTLEDFGMIEITDNGKIIIVNWEKYQNIEGLEKIREQTRQRVQKHRDKKKLEQLEDGKNVTENVTLRNATELEVDLESESDKEKDIDKAAKDIHVYWIDKAKIIHDARWTSNLKKKILVKLKCWDGESIKTAIDRYVEIYNSDYYYAHNWTLYKFIEQCNGAPRFIEGLDEKYDGDLWKDYKTSKNRAEIKGARDFDIN